MDDDAVFNVGFSVVEGCSGAGYQSMTETVKIERFSFDCRKVIGFAFATLHDWLKDLHQFFIQSEVQPKPIVTHSHAFFRALRQLPVITSSFDWFTVLCVLFVIR